MTDELNRLCRCGKCRAVFTEGDVVKPPPPMTNLEPEREMDERCPECDERNMIDHIEADGEEAADDRRAADDQNRKLRAENVRLTERLANADLELVQLRSRTEIQWRMIEAGPILANLRSLIFRGEPLSVGMDEQAHEPPTDRGESRRAVEACAGQARGIVDLTYAAARGPVPAKAAYAEEASFQSALNPEEIL